MTIQYHESTVWSLRLQQNLLENPDTWAVAQTQRALSWSSCQWIWRLAKRTAYRNPTAYQQSSSAHCRIDASINVASSNVTKLISNARIVTFRIVTFFQKNPNGSKVRKSDIFSIFEQNMCRVLVVWGCRVLVVFFLSISGNGWLMNSTACIYAQKLKHFYIMKTYENLLM